MSRKIVIVSGVRTASADFGGSLVGVSPCDLGVAVASESIARSGIGAEEVLQLIFGNVIHTAPEDMHLGQVAALRAKITDSAPALTLNRLSGSGLQAVISAAEQIELGKVDIALAGGAESMSRAGHLLTQGCQRQKMGDVTAVDMMGSALTDEFGSGHKGVTAENVATRSGIDRETQDAFAVRSHRRAAQAAAEGRFRDQILPMTVKAGGQRSCSTPTSMCAWTSPPRIWPRCARPFVRMVA